MALSNIAKIGIGALVAWFGYEAFVAPKPRFVGDKLEAGDRAVVDPSFVPEAAVLLPQGSVRLLVDVIGGPTGKDAFQGRVVGAVLADGTDVPITSPTAPPLGPPLEATLPRASVVEIRRGTARIRS